MERNRRITKKNGEKEQEQEEQDQEQSDTDIEQQQQQHDIVSFYTFIEQYIYPYVKVSLPNNDNPSDEYVLKRQMEHNAKVKAKRKSLLTKYTEPGQYGEQFACFQQ